MEVTASIYHLIGNPAHPIMHPEFVSQFHRQLTFIERVMSTLVSWYYKYYFAFTAFPERQKILNKSSQRALGLNTISIAGYRDDVSSQPLPPVSILEIKYPRNSNHKKFLDEAKEGCIYTIIEALSDVPYKVLWKFEAQTTSMPKNIKTADFHLYHPNVNLFLNQGGLQSMEETIYGEVPFVIIPFFSDQFQNSKILEDKGVAVVLNKQTLDKNELKYAIMEVMTVPKYHDGVKN
ncbi:UDP-glucuronosyltransferase 2B4-like [Anoplophora glabripennis]|uniref:UDP-glucuronosyltransferase 2B4-like n=1 Tax=Anoplophora glabripennis TaxID=217634 RepID=UPI000873906A|nr:UDP-glucuronosyltransferase 2B4-like [Anoplophora glabripennis]